MSGLKNALKFIHDSNHMLEINKFNSLTSQNHWLHKLYESNSKTSQLLIVNQSTSYTTRRLKYVYDESSDPTVTSLPFKASFTEMEENTIHKGIILHKWDINPDVGNHHFKAVITTIIFRLFKTAKNVRCTRRGLHEEKIYLKLLLTDNTTYLRKKMFFFSFSETI